MIASTVRLDTMKNTTATTRLAALAFFAAAAFAARPAAAVEPYVAGGFPFAVVGLAQPLNESFALRADFGTIGQRNYSYSTSGDDFKGDIHYSRAALVGDWFVAGGGFRISAGATFNQAKATMTASSHDGKITLGGIEYNAPSSLYYVQSDLSFPKASPYIGIGWGHHDSAPGLTFNFDLGASIGTAKATPLKASPALASELALSQDGTTDLAQESHDFQDDVRKFKAIPQLTFGLGYRF
jgi:hypothetical protein